MDAALFVQNIKKYCEVHSVKPTTACKESGVGASFINDINRGQTPSVAKVQMLAEYLGVTVSDLLGEEKEKPTPQTESELDEELIQKLVALRPDQLEKVKAYLQGMLDNG